MNSFTFGSNFCTTTGPNTSCDPFGEVKDMWYKFNSGNNSKISIDVYLEGATSLNFAVYDACSGSEILCKTSDGTRTSATLNNLQLNKQYFIQVWGKETEAGDYVIAVYRGETSVECTGIDYLNLNTNPIPNNTYFADFSINSNGIVPNGGTVTMKAKNSINLNAGFHAKAGSNFHALIVPCTYSIVSSEISADSRSDNGNNSDSLSFSEFQIIPNPLKQEAIIRFYLNQNESVQTFLYDMNGRLLTKQALIATKGWNESSLDASQLSAGLYYVILQNKLRRETKKIMVIK